MLVYKDIERVEIAGEKQAAIANALQKARVLTGLERHSALVEAFMLTSELIQSFADAAFLECGFDRRETANDQGMKTLCLLARTVIESWRSKNFATPAPKMSILNGLSGIEQTTLLRTKQAEGYTFYALYPESYAQAAERSGLNSDTRIIGIRSIGTGLSAMVAAVCNAPVPLTLRPIGHPFQRKVRVDPVLNEEVLKAGDSNFAIVDEGPGLSGSSFGAVGDWLEGLGVARERLHFFPSHNGAPGAMANPHHRERWRMATRHVVTTDALLSPPHRLTAWVEELLGPLERPLESIAGGAWRGKRYADETLWPPSYPQQERLKFLASTKNGLFLVKFAGFGEIGERKLERARAFSKAGFTTEVAGLRHGFLIERWHQDALSLDQAFIDCRGLVERIGSYLGFRARLSPVDGPSGASLAELGHMARHNTREILGENAAFTLERLLLKGDALNAQVRRVATDSRMQAWEWLLSGGQLLKTDALDHAAGHDLIGHQDIAWDVVGAEIELGLTEAQVQQLCRIIKAESGASISPTLLAFLRPCYLAFQAGYYAMAAQSLREGREIGRLQRASQGYARMLRSLL